jgi:UDP-N-acetylmuramoylalanine--D-glutamate ligase
LNVAFEEGGHSEGKILSAKEVIKSPGIPDNAPLIIKLREAGIPVISEIEFAGRYTNVPKICVTGSNGKTTTTTLIHHILTRAGMNAAMCGNVGQSFAGMVAEGGHDIYVLELSSFQLDGMYDFKAEVAVLLNITPDHLDRYNYSLEEYANSKFRIIQNQTAEDHFIFYTDDPIVSKGLTTRNSQAQHYPISLSHSIDELGGQGAGIENETIQINTKNQPFTMKIQELALQGRHNLVNSMAAGVSARLFELRKELVRESLIDFDNIEHRLEFVTKVHGITFINDSKATNVNSTWYALESVDKPIIWIAGGVDKGNNYSELYELVKNRVKAIICLGKDNDKIKAAFADKVDTLVEVESAEDAVRIAYDLGYKGDVVLLSPACASFDLFENYEDRGHQFKQAVRRL